MKLNHGPCCVICYLGVVRVDVVDPLTFENTFLSLRISSPFQLLFILGCLGSNVPQLRRCLDGQTYRVRLLDFIF